MKKSRALLSIFLVIWMIVLLSVASYAWIQRNWTATIHHDKIAISTAGSLVMQLTPEKSAENLKWIDMGEDIPGFTFKQVSSYNGKDFFYGDFVKTPTFKKDISRSRYLETTFYLKYQSTTTDQDHGKYVFIHPDTWINTFDEDKYGPAASKAIRIAIIVDSDDPNTEKTIILSRLGDEKRKDYSTTDILNKDVYMATPNAEGQYIYENYDPNVAVNTPNTDASAVRNTYGLHYLDGGRRNAADLSAYDAYNFTPDPSLTITRIAHGEIKQITVRIWLEGGDEQYCTGEISEKEVEMLLKFDSIDDPKTNNNVNGGNSSVIE